MKEEDSLPWCDPPCGLGQGLSKEIIGTAIKVHHLGPRLPARLQAGFKLCVLCGELFLFTDQSICVKWRACPPVF
jgi:hypothetical protein